MERLLDGLRGTAAPWDVFTMPIMQGRAVIGEFLPKGK
jgi:hypothetical protein